MIKQQITKLASQPLLRLNKLMNSSLISFALASAALCASTANAYELKTVFKTEHFAINQVILAPHESLDRPTESSIMGDVQTQNRLENLYHSSTVIFPAGSKGYTGKINTPILGVLTIANYNTGKDRVFFNRKAKYLTEGAIYLSHKQLIEMVNQKALNDLLSEFSKIPLVITDIPVKATGFDPTTKAFYITALDPAIIIDARIDDSVFYSKEKMYTTIKEGCTVSMLTFVDRAIANIPVFFSARGAINSIDCSKQVVTKPEAAEAISQSISKSPAIGADEKASARDEKNAQKFPVHQELADPVQEATPKAPATEHEESTVPSIPSFDADSTDSGVPQAPSF